jgi:anti-sigma-K factor RskA
VNDRDCDRLWQVDAYRAGLLGDRDAESFERHARACATCREQLEGDERLRELAAELPCEAPSPLVLRRLRMRLLHGAGVGAAPDRRVLGWRAAAAVALVFLLGVGGALTVVGRAGAPPRGSASASKTSAAPVAILAEAFAGSVAAAPDARWTQARNAGIERVDLSEGTLHLSVRPQAVGERFLIELPDGEIEVRGTTFDVTVEEGTTRRVHVAEGLVELRLRGQDVVHLGPSESWQPPSRPIAQAPVRPSAERSPPPSPPGIAGEADSALAYVEAVRLLRDGRNDDAAARFHAFLLSHPSSAQAEDASFLEAVALARGGRTDAAALAGEHHLAGFPRSFHAREAAILVARAASQRHDCDKARAVLAPWAKAGGGPDVASALGSCGADGARP